ncbi:MAG: hypothetical protein COA79_08685 [Planctomycetota bacterium]|nr:MAG: hypothetical protein COA79_08685 [Planctomycetota bacterium]
MIKKRNATYKKIIGTGGIGKGIIYQLEGNQTLGRNESRLGTLLDQKDFCKQHIILHYCSSILKELNTGISILPVGAIGDDASGKEVLKLIKQVGMKTSYITTFKNTPTLNSICFQYSDHEGGNITEKNSASDKVSPTLIRKVKKEFEKTKGPCLTVGAPEVPFKSRLELAKLGSKFNSFNTGSFVPSEIKKVMQSEYLTLLDLLAINLEEASALTGKLSSKTPDQIVKACTQKIWKINPSLKLSITNGSKGAFGCENGKIEKLTGLKTKVANTAGGGDASFAGLLIGLALGYPFMGKKGLTCVQLARLLSSMSVTSADTIHFGINIKTLKSFSKQQKQKIFSDLIHD